MRILLICCLLITVVTLVANAEEKENPDGILNAPTITIWGGLGKGSQEYTISENGLSFIQDGDFKGSTIAVEILYPTTESLSLILRFNANLEKLEYFANRDFYENKSKINSYALNFGIRFFTR